MNESQLKKPLATLEGFCGIVTCLAFSPDAHWLVSGATNGSVTLWDIASRTAVKTFEGHSESIVTVAFSFDGMTLLSGAADGVLIAWDLDSGNQIWTDEDFAGKPRSALFVPFTEHLLWLTQDNTFKICNPRVNKIVSTIRTLPLYKEPAESIAFSPDGQTIASGNRDHTVKLLDTSTGKLLRTFSGHSDSVTSVAFSPDGQTIASASQDSTVRIWDTSTGKLLRTFSRHSDSVTSVAFSPDGQTIASIGSYGTVILWQVDTGKLLRTPSGHSASVTSVAFSPDGQTIVSGSEDGSLERWRLDSGKMSPISRAVHKEIIAIASGPDDQRVLAADMNGRLSFFELTPDGKEYLVCHTDFNTWNNYAQVMSQSLNGRFALLITALSTTIRLLDLTTGQAARSFVGHKKQVLSAAFSPDDAFLVSGGVDRVIHLWRVSSGELVRSLRAHTGFVRAVTFSPDGHYIASGGDDQTIKLWHGANPGGAATFQPVVSPSRRGPPMTLPESPPASLAVPGANQELVDAMRVQIDTHEKRVAKLEFLVEKLFRLLDSPGKAPPEDAVIIQRKSFDDF